MPFVSLILASALVDREAPPFEYVRPSAGGKYVFVMLVPPERRQYVSNFFEYADADGSESVSRDGQLFKKYPKSGLYRVGETRTPLWSVDWYSYDVRACSDGSHLVRYGPWARSNDKGKTLATAFYRSGETIKSYEVRDIVKDTGKLPHSISHYMWEKVKEFDDARMRVRIDVLTEMSYDTSRRLVFDIKTGLIVQA